MVYTMYKKRVEGTCRVSIRFNWSSTLSTHRVDKIMNNFNLKILKLSFYFCFASCGLMIWLHRVHAVCTTSSQWFIELLRQLYSVLQYRTFVKQLKWIVQFQELYSMVKI